MDISREQLAATPASCDTYTNRPPSHDPCRQYQDAQDAVDAGHRVAGAVSETNLTGHHVRRIENWLCARQEGRLHGTRAFSRLAAFDGVVTRSIRGGTISKIWGPSTTRMNERHIYIEWDHQREALQKAFG